MQVGGLTAQPGASDGGLIKACHGHTNSEPEIDGCEESPDEVAIKFNGTCSRLSAGAACLVYLRSGGMLLGAFAVLVAVITQTTRILSDWWIRRVWQQ
jgi:hypothetical protein